MMDNRRAAGMADVPHEEPAVPETASENRHRSKEYLARLEVDGFLRGVDNSPFQEGEGGSGAEELIALGQDAKALLRGENPQAAILARVPAIDVGRIPERKLAETRLALGFLIQCHVWSEAARFVAKNFGKRKEEVVAEFKRLHPDLDCAKFFEEAGVDTLEPKVAKKIANELAVESVPEALARPYVEISEKLGLPAIFNYADYVLLNFDRSQHANIMAAEEPLMQAQEKRRVVSDRVLKESGEYAALQEKLAGLERRKAGSLAEAKDAEKAEIEKAFKMEKASLLEELRVAEAEATRVATQEVPMPEYAFRAKYTFTDEKSEHGFILTHLIYEQKGAEAIRSGDKLLAAAEQGDKQEVLRELQAFTGIVRELRRRFDTVNISTETEDFARFFRSFITGFKGNVPGIRFEGTSGVDPVSKKKFSELRGETGAESSLLPFLDSVTDLATFMAKLEPTYLEWRTHMPVEDRLFLEDVQKRGVKLFELVRANPELQAAYEEVIEQIYGIRNDHLRTIVKYIGGSYLGTGGTTGNKAGYLPMLAGSMEGAKKRLRGAT